MPHRTRCNIWPKFLALQVLCHFTLFKNGTRNHNLKKSGAGFSGQWISLWRHFGIDTRKLNARSYIWQKTCEQVRVILMCLACALRRINLLPIGAVGSL
jgi:hypothetical protein